MKNSCIIMLLLLLLSACATVPNPAPLPIQAKATAPSKDYQIQPGDILDIKFFYNPELNETVTVRPDGRVALQLVKELDVTGRTPLQLTDLLVQRYSTQIKNPEITVLVRSFNSLKVYVDGEVNRAGMVALAEPMTALQAISQAGGAKLDSARMGEVVLIRKGDNNEKITMTLDLDKAVSGSDPKQDVLLKPYDIVYVPRTSITNVDLWVDQYIRKILPFSTNFGVYKTY